MEKSQEIYIKKTRKFHDAWAFMLYLIVHIGCTTFTVLNIKEGSLNLEFMNVEIQHAYICFAVVMFFMVINFGGLRLIPNIYLKVMICLFPVITIYIAIHISRSSTYVTAIFVIFLWGLFMVYYWSKISTIAGIIKITMKLLLSNLFAVICGILICSSLQILQLYVTIQLNVFDLISNRMLYVLILFNTYWSFANFICFYKVYATSVVAYHYINKEEHSVLVCREALRNSFYALGSISFAGFIISLIYTAQYFLEENENSDNNVRSKFNVDRLLIRIISCFSDIVVEVIELVHDLTLPYLAIHGESYIQSTINSYKVYTENSLLFGGIKALDYSLYLSSFLVYAGCFGSFTYALNLIPQSLKSECTLRLLIIAVIPLMFYATTMMTITSSYLGLLYFNAENSDLVKEKNPQIETLIKSL
jgi:hypothetical protein